nr:unnamed protein product [Digitaria exilis]
MWGAWRPVYGSFTRCDDCALALDAIDPLTLRPELRKSTDGYLPPRIDEYPLEACNLDAYKELLRQEAEEGNPEELQHQSEGPAPCIATTQKDLIQHPSSPHHHRP